MRVAADRDASRLRWLATPALSSTAGLGGPRPGAIVLATAGSAGGLGRPLVAVQRYGEGRSMIFGGEGLFLATLRGHGTVWLQSLPFSRLADRILANAPSSGGRATGEGSVLGGFGRILDGD